MLNDINNISSIDIVKIELYEELLNIENKLEQEYMVAKCRERAKALGKTSVFDKLWQAAKKQRALQIAESIKEVIGRKTDFPSRDTDLQFDCSTWIANETGIWLQVQNGMTIPVCKHPIYPVKILRNAETGKYKVELEYVLRGQLHNIMVPREMLADPHKILSLAGDGIQVTSITSKYLVQFLSDIESLNPDLIKEYTSTSRLGWIKYEGQDKNTTTRFLPYQEEVIFDNEESIKSLFDSVKSYGSRDEWYDLIIKERARQKPELNINLAASFASVLVEPCGLLPFIVSLWGGTGIGKSVILKLCTSIWADPGEGKYITDAKATYTAMEIRLNALNSLPMALDDMAQVKNQYDEDYSEIIYRWCAGKGRDRANKELGLNKLTSWRNCILTNGERSLVDESTQGGAINRVIDVEASGEAIFDGKSGSQVVNCIENNYGYAGAEFIDVINELGFDKIKDIYEEQYNRIKEHAAKKGVEKEDKQVVPMALILTADLISEKYLFKDNITLNIDTCVNYLKNKGDVSENERAYEWLINAISLYSSHFAESAAEDIYSSSGDWGYWQDQTHIVINGNKFDELLKEAGFQSKTFLSWCKKNNIIETDKAGNPKKPVRPPKRKAFRAVVLDVTYKSKNAQTNDDDNSNEFIKIEAIQQKLPFV